MSKDTYRYSKVSKYLGIEPLEEVIGVRRDKFSKRHCATDITYAVWLMPAIG